MSYSDIEKKGRCDCCHCCCTKKLVYKSVTSPTLTSKEETSHTKNENDKQSVFKKISPLTYKVTLMPSGGLFLERFFFFLVVEDQKFRCKMQDGAVDHSDVIVNEKVIF